MAKILDMLFVNYEFDGYHKHRFLLTRLQNGLMFNRSRTLGLERGSEGNGYTKHVGMNFRVKRLVASAPKFLRKMGQAHFSHVRYAPALAGHCARSTQ